MPIPVPKAEVKLSKSQKDLAKAAKGTKSISSFFTPKKTVKK